jgi:hypothetical protein
MDLREIAMEGVNWTHVTHVSIETGDRWCQLANTVMNLSIP